MQCSGDSNCSSNAVRLRPSIREASTVKKFSVLASAFLRLVIGVILLGEAVCSGTGNRSSEALRQRAGSSCEGCEELV
jgi:hypothetical protein